MQPRSAKLLEDVRDAADFIRESARGKTLIDYRANRMLVWSTIETQVPALLKDVEELLAAKG